MRKIKTLNKTENGSVYTLWDTADGEFELTYTYGMMDLLAADLGEDAAQYQTILDEVAATYVPPVSLAPEQLQTMVVQATQRRLDDFASTRNYDDILSACTYAASAVPKFATEGQYAVTVRDTTWAALYALMAEVQTGTRQLPTSFADIEPLLPALEWPT